MHVEMSSEALVIHPDPQAPLLVLRQQLQIDSKLTASVAQQIALLQAVALSIVSGS